VKYYASVLFVGGLVGAALYVAAQNPGQAPKGGGAPQVPVMSAAVAECEKLRRHGDPGERACYQRLSRSNDPLTRGEGFWGLKDYNAANDAFRDAAKARPKDPVPLIRWGRMFLEHWQPGDAGDLFGEALELHTNNADALLGMAMVLSESFSGKAIDYAERALEANPKLAEAYELMARMALEDNNPAKAVEQAKKALELSPEALDAMSILATVDLMNDKSDTPWLDSIFKINPKYGEAYETAGYFLVINRRYAEGIAYYRKALQLKPDLLSAQSELGINLMRFGQEQEARRLLEDAYDRGYRNAATANSLKLLDSYKNFETFKTPGAVLILHKKEAALLKPYFQAELERAIATYEKKYKFKLNGPVQLEVYPDHEDFAVRTMGLPGLGALGVTFGQYVAMDSPSGRKPGEFHWASTLWHELSHVFVLSMTQHRVPRWFTEGVAVYEETAAAPDWGDRLDRPSIQAIKDKKLLPIAELDRGFIHPTYPEQVVVSYFQGGRVISFIVEKFGYDKVLAMIKAFGDRKTTAEVIEQELKMKPEEFDKQFFPWLEEQTKKTVEGFDTWRQRLRAVNESAKNKDWGAVIRAGLEIRDIYPDYVEAGSVYEFLSEAYLARGDKIAAMQELERYALVGGRNPSTLKQLAGLQAEAGKKREAAATLERLNLIYLQDEAAHQKLGDLYIDLGNANLAIREFQTVLAGKPVDPAQAHYQLGRAFQMAKRLDDARESVYSALEAAPNFRPAQRLLLELGDK
jgi:tetratricopeptide (TPR) repeat protein